MDYITRISSLEQLKAQAQVSRALDHLSSDDFLYLSEDERKAHAAAYREELPNLKRRIPNHSRSQSQIHLLSTFLQLYE